jgi:hypothetical protein
MRSASSKALLAAAVAALVAAAAALPHGGVHHTPARGGLFSFAQRASVPLTSAGSRRLASLAWSGGPITAADGETLTVFVSDTYAGDPSVAQKWADFFTGLVHGSELSQLQVYVATPAEVTSTCGNTDALGCYGDDRMIVPGEVDDGVDPTQVATHEYGHHVAYHRVNPPWDAIDWGTKRWASYLDVCNRAATNSFFPGDEGLHYRQNPGEGFAEAYRALNNSKHGATTFDWPIVDTIFYPDTTALQAIEQDVLQPWTAPTLKIVHGRFTKQGRRRFTLTLTTPLDGSLALDLKLPKGGLYSLDLLAADGNTKLASGLWSATNEKTLSFTICGQRTLRIAVTRLGAPGRFLLTISHP